MRNDNTQRQQNKNFKLFIYLDSTTKKEGFLKRIYGIVCLAIITKKEIDSI